MCSKCDLLKLLNGRTLVFEKVEPRQRVKPGAVELGYDHFGKMLALGRRPYEDLPLSYIGNHGAVRSDYTYTLSGRDGVPLPRGSSPGNVGTVHILLVEEL